MLFGIHHSLFWKIYTCIVHLKNKNCMRNRMSIVPRFALLLWGFKIKLARKRHFYSWWRKSAICSKMTDRTSSALWPQSISPMVHSIWRLSDHNKWTFLEKLLFFGRCIASVNRKFWLKVSILLTLHMDYTCIWVSGVWEVKSRM